MLVRPTSSLTPTLANAIDAMRTAHPALKGLRPLSPPPARKRRSVLAELHRLDSPAILHCILHPVTRPGDDADSGPRPKPSATVRVSALCAFFTESPAVPAEAQERVLALDSPSGPHAVLEDAVFGRRCTDYSPASDQELDIEALRPTPSRTDGVRTSTNCVVIRHEYIAQLTQSSLATN
ncbi:hypothetical protein PsYK624_064080 [Phanerochaete sordida]|uniref:Uncharacterized protein n=1 Tax=Phanerochaete sordida TaxID=48140 RepID=A0A9P3LD67_9APHY|nr:hypothetical protein PsYK624_064080 [Phanerochaete sordida]